MIQTLPQPENQPRIETGVVQFGDDWPGVFIRGDNACIYGFLLQQLLDDPDIDPLVKLNLGGLPELLLSCQVKPNDPIAPTA